MTDQELLELIQRNEPGDLTPQELAEIESRLPESETIREALAARLKLEASVASTLGRPDVSVSAILREQRREKAWGWIAPSLGVGLCLLAVVLGGFVFYRALFVHSVDPLEVDATAPDDEATDKDRPLAMAAFEEPPSPDEPEAVDVPIKVTQQPPAIKVDALPFAWQAEDFEKGNVKSNRREWGSDDVEVILSTEKPAFVEYEFSLPEAAKLELQLRFAAFDSRPLVALINGQRLPSSVAADQTGGDTVEHQQWRTAGAHQFVAGRNTLRFETTGRFPHVDQWKLQQPTAISEPTTDPDKPWAGILADDYQPRKFHDICFDEFDLSKSMTRLEDVQRWFATVPGVSSQIRPVSLHNIKNAGRITGVARLKSPWQDGVALHLRPRVEKRLDIHFFRGEKGVTFSYHRHQLDTWAVYNTTRKPDAPTPETFLLAATDSGRNRRTEFARGGSYLLRFEAGELTLSRGDIRLASGQLGGLPTEVYFEGDVTIEGLELLRTEDGVEQPSTDEVVMSLDRPADWKWSEPTSAGAELKSLPDGSIQMIANNTEQLGWITTPMPGIGARFVDWEIRNPTAGSGIFLGRGEKGEPNEVVRFFRNTRDGKLAVAITPNDQRNEREFATLESGVVPLVGERVWIRMLLGAGIFHWWVSHDGEHWALADQPWIDRPGDVTHLGLNYVGKTENCGLTVASVLIRELSGLAAVAPKEWIEQAPTTLHTAAKYDEWRSQATLCQPAGVDLETWLRACTVQTLRSGVSKSLGSDLLLRLLENSIDTISTEAQIELIADSALLLALRDDNSLTEKLVRFGARVAAAKRDENVSEEIRRRLMSAPFHANHNPPMFDWREVDANLVRLVYQDDESLADYVKMLRFFHFEDRTKLDEWAAAQAGGDIVQRTKRLPTKWRHPYREQINKSVYNGFAEIRALVESEAFEDAARRIAAVDVSSFEGLAPYDGGVDWMVSFMTAVRQMQRENPELGAAIQSQFASLAALRLQRAINEQDSTAIEAIAEQFAGAEAAGDAHQWLGDQALSSGWFHKAISEYRRAEQSSGSSATLNARLRLAGAMSGDELGIPVTDSVEFGGDVMTAKAFETLIASLQTQNSSATNAAANSDRAPLPEPAALRLENKSRFDGPVGDAASTEGVRNTYSFEIDWVGKQLAVAVDESTAYVSNRFQVSAYKLEDGSRIWRSQTPPGVSQMKAQAHTFVPMKPIVRGDSIIARQMYGKGPMMVCLNKDDGKILWTQSGTDEEFFASDPVFIEGRLAAVVARQVGDNEITMEWWLLDEETGARIASRELLRVSDSWRFRSHCQIADTGEGAVIAFGGVVVQCDSAGDVRWVRRQTNTPLDEDETWVRQHAQPPVVRNDRVFVAQPGVRTLDCLDIETGQLYWRAILPKIERLLTVRDDAAIIQTSRGIAALNTETGSPIWKRPFNNGLYVGYSVGGDRLMVIEKVERKEPIQWTAQLLWLDLQSGDTIAASPLKSVTENEMRLGPIVHAGEHLYVFRGRGKTDPNRDFARLAPFEDGELIQSAQQGAYPPGVIDALATAAEKRFENWQLLSGDKRSEGLQDKTEGKDNVFVVKASGGRPATFGQRLTIPTKGNPTLRIEIGQRGTHLYLLKIFVEGEEVTMQKTDELTGDAQWGTFNFDLTRWAGKEVWVGVQGIGRYGGEEVDTLWRRIEITN